jgi:hypothetical protein
MAASRILDAGRADQRSHGRQRPRSDHDLCGFTLAEATDINAIGEIVGWGQCPAIVSRLSREIEKANTVFA